MWSPTHVQVTVQRAKSLLTKGKHKTNDCFVTIALGKEKYQTSVKEKAARDVEWHEECELIIPEQGNTAEIVLTALHRNFLGVDEFLGTISIPLSSFDVYERPRNRWYPLGSKPGKENTKERGELEVKIGFIVKAGSLTDLSHKERHKSSLGQLSNAAHSIGGSLLSIGSFEKRKGFQKIAKSLSNRVKGKSKHNIDKEDDLVERNERKFKTPTRQQPGEADPGVISEDEDEFTFDDLSHKSSASSLNAPVVGGNSNSVVSISSSVSSGNHSNEANHPPPAPANAAPSKPPRYSMSASATNLSKVDNTKDDEWGIKLYGKQAHSNVKRWENKASPKIVIDEPKEDHRESSPVGSPSTTSTLRFQETPEPPVPAPREVLQNKNKEDRPVSNKEKSLKEEKLKEKKEERYSCWSPKDDKQSRKDKKKEKENKLKELNDDNSHLSSERIIIGGEDAIRSTITGKSHLPHEVLTQFDGKSREDLIELTLQLQSEVMEKKKRLNDLEDYIDVLLLRVIECSPRLLQNPYQT